MHHGRRIGSSWHVLQVEDNAGILLLLLTGLLGSVLVLCVKVPQVSAEKVLLLHSSSSLYYHRTIGVGLGSQFDLILSALFWMEMEFLCGGTEGLLDGTRNDCRSAERVLSTCINKGRIRRYQSCRQLTGRFWIHFFTAYILSSTDETGTHAAGTPRAECAEKPRKKDASLPTSIYAATRTNRVWIQPFGSGKSRPGRGHQ